MENHIYSLLFRKEFITEPSESHLKAAPNISGAAERRNMKSLTIWFPISPQPWQRPKTRIINGWVQHYSPKKTTEYEREIADYFRSHPQRFKFEKDIPVAINLVFGMPIPKSTPKSRKDAMIEGVIKHTKRPDVDNMAKAVLDALNGLAWADDSQIVRLSITKEYTREPYVYLYMYEYTD